MPRCSVACMPHAGTSTTDLEQPLEGVPSAVHSKISIHCQYPCLFVDTLFACGVRSALCVFLCARACSVLAGVCSCVLCVCFAYALVCSGCLLCVRCSLFHDVCRCSLCSLLCHVRVCVYPCVLLCALRLIFFDMCSLV